MNQLNLYYIFYTVAQCKNISAAAKKLYISQPAVSKSISKLEESFPSPLLYRTSKGVELTDSGNILYQQLDTAFGAIKHGEDLILKNNALGVGSLSIGVSSTLCKYMLLPYLKTFMENNPHIKVSISCQSTYETLNDLENGSLDIGLIGESDRMGNLTFKPFREIHDSFVADKNYIEKLQKENGLDALQTKASKELLQDATFLILNKNNVTRQYMDKYMLLQDIVMEHQMEVTSMDLLIDFAKLGLGVACVIKEFVSEELKNGDLLELEPETPIPSRRIGFAFNKNSLPNPAVQKFLDTI